MRLLCGRVAQTASARWHQFGALQTRTLTHRPAYVEADSLLHSGSFSRLVGQHVGALGAFDIRGSVRCSGGRRILDPRGCTFWRDIPKRNTRLDKPPVFKPHDRALPRDVKTIFMSPRCLFHISRRWRAPSSRLARTAIVLRSLASIYNLLRAGRPKGCR